MFRFFSVCMAMGVICLTGSADDGSCAAGQTGGTVAVTQMILGAGHFDAKSDRTSLRLSSAIPGDELSRGPATFRI